jgi:hypothetical protein
MKPEVVATNGSFARNSAAARTIGPIAMLPVLPTNRKRRQSRPPFPPDG